MLNFTQPVAVLGAAFLALVGVCGTLIMTYRQHRMDTKWRERQEVVRQESEVKQRRLELLSSAFSYLEGGSQRRSVGLAMLAILLGELKDDYEESAFQLLLTQLRYLLSHGSNRWEGHEIANMELIFKILATRAQAWLEVDSARMLALAEDINQFLNDSREFATWTPGKKRTDGGRPNRPAITRFRELMEQWKSQNRLSSVDPA